MSDLGRKQLMRLLERKRSVPSTVADAILASKWLRDHEDRVKAAAWEEGARWAAVEFSGDDRYERGAGFLAPGDNPYTEGEQG